MRRRGGGVDEVRVSKDTPTKPRKRLQPRALIEDDTAPHSSNSGFLAFKEIPLSQQQVSETPVKTTPSRGNMLREKSANEKNLLTPLSQSKNAGGRLPPFFAPFNPVFSTPVKGDQDVASRFPATPVSSKGSARPELVEAFHAPSPFSAPRLVSKPSESRFATAAVKSHKPASSAPVVHPFWSPSPKRVWSYLIAGGMSDFLHCAISNVEDIQELQKNGHVYFSGGSVPFSATQTSKTSIVEKCQRWNRFCWKVEVSDDGSGTTTKAILMRPHNKGKEDFSLKEGSKVRLGPVHQELQHLKVYMKWQLLE